MANQSKQQKRVGIWIRVSTEDQAQGESPEHHEARARMYAEAKGWQVVRVYDLSGVSGKSVAGHSEAQAMLADIEAGRITGLLFSKLARLARNTKELLEFADFFQQQNADLVSLQESIDTSTPAGRFFYTLLAGVAQWEREEISDRVKASVKVRAKLGKSLGGPAPYGYFWKDKQLVLDPHEAPIRKLMFELFAEHKRLRFVARLLNEAGYRTRRKAKFSDTTIRRLLADPVAKGQRRMNYTRSLGEGKRWVIKPESEWVINPVPAIVSEELWNECNRILDEWKHKKKPRRRKVKYLFSGLTYCRCGTKMYRPSNLKKYYCRKCLNKIHERDLELVFSGELKKFFLDTDEINNRLQVNDDVLAEKRDLFASLVTQKANVEREMDLVYRLYVEGQLTTDGFGRRNGPLEKQLDELAATIPRLQAEIDSLAISHMSTSAVISEAQTLYSSWSFLTFDEKLAIVETIVDRIEVGEDTVDIDLAYVPSNPSAARQERSPPSPRTVVKRQHNRVPAPALMTPERFVPVLQRKCSAIWPKSVDRSLIASIFISR